MSDDLGPWPDKMYLLHPSIKTFGGMVSNPERREYVRADRIEELERDKVLDDGRPCVTDVFLSAAIEQLDDKWDFFEAVKCWCEGDWEGALEGIELEGKE